VAITFATNAEHCGAINTTTAKIKYQLTSCPQNKINRKMHKKGRIQRRSLKAGLVASLAAYV